MTEVTQSLTMEFGPLRISYDDQVLEPRAWTRLQSEWASQLLVGLPEGPVLELCSGAGHIGLLAVHRSGRTLVAVDANPAACAWTRTNAEAHGIPVEVREGDLDAVIDTAERFPLIIADPPWVPHDSIQRFPDDPPIAIDGGPDGLELARRCVRLIARHLDAGGSALLQLGDETQVRDLTEEITDAGLRVQDLQAQPGRGVVAQLVAA